MTQSTSAGVYRDGDCFVVTEGAPMPARCPVCNSPDVADPLEVRFAEPRKRGLIKDAVAAGMVHLRGWNYTGPVVVQVSFCAKHRARRTYLLIAGLLLIVIGVAAFCTELNMKNKGPVAIIGIVAAMLGLIGTFATLSGALNPWFKAKRFDDRTVWAKGACPAFLDALPPSGGATSG
jgi:hypothetical protein